MPNRIPIRRVRIGPPRRGRVQDDAYLAWLRTLPCIACATLRYVEAAHVGPRGISQKCHDRQALPICSEHHWRGAKSVHVLGRKFWEVWGLDRYRLIAEHNQQYEDQVKEQI